MSDVDETLTAIREFANREGLSPSGLARRVGLGVNTLRSMHSSSWQPNINTIKKLHTYLITAGGQFYNDEKKISSVSSSKVLVDANLVRQAEELGIDVIKTCENEISRQISDEKMRRWNEENKEALKAWDDYVEEHGLPFAEYRQF